MPTTPVNALRYPASSAAPNIPQDFQNLATDLDAKVPLSVATMAARPTTNRVVGMTVRPLNRPTVSYVWDGNRWFQEGLFADVVGSAPAGSYISKQQGTAAVTPANVNGFFGVTLPFAFSALPLFAWFTPGDTASGVSQTVYAIGNSTASALNGFAYKPNGTPLTTTETFRVNYVAIGYNT